MLSNSQGQSPPVPFPAPAPPPQPPAPAPAPPHPPAQPPPPPPQQFPQFHVKSGLQIKKNAIIDDYKVTSQVLGLGINGKVLQIFNKRTQEKFALKVGLGPGEGRRGRPRALELPSVGFPSRPGSRRWRRGGRGGAGRPGRGCRVRGGRRVPAPSPP